MGYKKYYKPVINKRNPVNLLLYPEIVVFIVSETSTKKKVSYRISKTVCLSLKGEFIFQHPRSDQEGPFLIRFAIYRSAKAELCVCRI